MYINSLDDLRREVSDQVDFMQLSLYSLPYDELVDAVTDDFRFVLENQYDFSWGMELPKMDDEVFWDLFKSYEND